MKLIVLLLLFQSQAGTRDPGLTPEVPLEELYDEGLASVSASRWDDAIAAFSTVLEADPSHLPSKFYLAASFNGKGEVDRAIGLYREILAEDGTVFEARMNLAVLLFENGDREAAVDEFALAMELAPANPAPALYRAQALDQLGRPDEAIAAYREVLTVTGGDGEAALEAYRRLGALYLAGGRTDDARELLTEATRLGAGDPFVFVTLGDLHSASDALEEARASYERALELAPGDRDIQLRLALLLRAMGRHGEAIALLEDLNDVDALLADTYLSDSRYADAIPIYETLTANEPGNPDYWWGLGRSRYETGDFDAAIPPLARTITLAPERYEALGALASIYYQREDWVRAGNTLLDYLEIRPNHAPSVFLLATCYDYVGDYEQALLRYNQFIEVDDGSDDARSFQVQQRARSLERLLEDN